MSKTTFVNANVTGKWFFFWLVNLLEKIQKAIRKLLNMIGTMWLCESTFSIVNFMKSKYSISDENLASALRCTVSIKYTSDSKTVWFKRMKTINNFHIEYMLKW